MKSILIIGMGKFGKFLAKKFTDLGNHVMAMDINEEKISEITPYVTTSRIGDATKESVLDSLGIDNFDLCVVAICENFQSSLQTTSLLKEGGAHHVLACACTEIQEKFLLRNGADEVVFAEKQSRSAQPCFTVRTTCSTMYSLRPNMRYTRYRCRRAGRVNRYAKKTCVPSITLTYLR